jgi:hypothetical protein
LKITRRRSASARQHQPLTRHEPDELRQSGAGSHDRFRQPVSTGATCVWPGFHLTTRMAPAMLWRTAPSATAGGWSDNWRAAASPVKPSRSSRTVSRRARPNACSTPRVDRRHAAARAGRGIEPGTAPRRLRHPRGSPRGRHPSARRRRLTRCGELHLTEDARRPRKIGRQPINGGSCAGSAPCQMAAAVGEFDVGSRKSAAGVLYALAGPSGERLTRG